MTESKEELTKEILSSVSAATLKKLNEAGFTTLEKLAVTPPKNVEESAGISLSLAEKVTGLAIKATLVYQTAEEYYDRRFKSLQRLTTGSKELDGILAGGLETGVITELIGPFSGGKTQLCYTASVLVQRPVEEGGLNGNALVIDTEGTFLPERIVQIAETRELDVKQTLHNIKILKIYSTRQLEIAVRELPSKLRDMNIKLLIIDSLASHFRSEYMGRENLAPRQQTLGGILGNLLRVAESFNLVCIVTNQMQGNPTAFGGPKPALGHVMAHAGTHRVMLRKGRNNVRIAKIIDSPYLPEFEAPFVLTERGIEDVPS